MTEDNRPKDQDLTITNPEAIKLEADSSSKDLFEENYKRKHEKWGTMEKQGLVVGRGDQLMIQEAFPMAKNNNCKCASLWNIITKPFKKFWKWTYKGYNK